MSKIDDLVRSLRQWRDTTPDAWILAAADNLERLDREAAHHHHEWRLTKIKLAEAQNEIARLRKTIGTDGRGAQPNTATCVFMGGKLQLTVDRDECGDPIADVITLSDEIMACAERIEPIIEAAARALHSEEPGR